MCDQPDTTCSRTGLIIMALLSFVSSVLYLALMPEPIISSDSQDYITLADSLSSEGTFSRDGRIETYRTPGYPVFLAALETPGISSFFQVAVMQSLLFSLALTALARRVSLHSGRNRTWLMVALVLLMPGTHLLNASILTETLFVVMLILCILACVGALQKQQSAWLLFAGICLGVATLIRPIAAYLWIPFVLYLALVPGTRTQRLRYVVCLLTGIMLTQGAWVARNAYHTGQAYLTELSAASAYIYIARPALALAAHEPIEAGIETGWEDWHRNAQSKSAPEMKELFTENAWNIILQHPAATAQVLVSGAVRLLIDSGSMKAMQAIHPALPLRLSEQLRGLTRPASATEWLLSLALALLRTTELLVVLVLHGLAFVRLVSLLRTDSIMNPNNTLLAICMLITIYLFALSCTAAANVRFRSCYIPFLITAVCLYPAKKSLGSSTEAA